MASKEEGDGELSVADNLGRTAQFWSRSVSIYAGYKATQLQALAARAAGRDAETVNRTLWDPQQERAAEQMYDLCISLRGFYLKASTQPALSERCSGSPHPPGCPLS